MPAVWSCFDVAAGTFLWYTQDEQFANTIHEPTPGAWVLEEDPTDHLTGLVFVGAPTMNGGEYYQFRDPVSFLITVEPLAVAEARKKAEAAAQKKAARPSPAMTASFVEEILVRRGADPAAAKKQASGMIKKLSTTTAAEDDWDDLGTD